MRFFHVTVFASLLLGCAAAQAADLPTINVTVGGEVAPGVYGRVQFGNAPPPAVVYAQPTVAVQQNRKVMQQEPIYLHVPPGHAKDWARHCQEYNACDRPVYFVKSAEYEPGYGERRNEGRREEGRGEERGRGHEGRRDRDEERRDDYREEDRGEGRGEGRGRGHREERD